MGTSMLGCETLTLAPGSRRNLKFPNTNVTASRRRKRTSRPKDLNRRSESEAQSMMVAKFPAKNLVMGQVKILKRGEPLGVLAENRQPRVKSEAEDPDLLLGSTNRMGPDPETVRKQMMRITEVNRVVDGVFAGTAFVASPPPSSLPVPVFLGKGIRSGNK